MTKQRIACIAVGLMAAAAAAAMDVVGCNLGGGDRSSADPPAIPMAPLSDLTLLITGNTSGNMEPCNCPGQPRGGLSRRQTTIDALRGGRGNFVLLDNGDLLDLVPDALSDGYMVSGYALLHYDAIAVGDQELDRGPARFVGMAQAGRLPIVATNVTLKGRPLGSSYQLLERNGRRVLVTAVVGPQMLAFSNEQVRREIVVTDPVDAVLLTLAEVEAGTLGRPPDLGIVLATLSPTERDEVVRRLGKVAGVDLVVLSTDQDRPVKLERFGGAAAVYAPARGRQIAVVGVNFATPGQPPKAAIAYVYGCPVEQALPRAKPLWELYQSYTYDAHQRTLNLVGKLGAVRFVDSDQCGACHVVQYEAWRKHKHGQSWATIEHEGRTMDPACMRCHTTGFGFEGGFRSPQLTPLLADVGCQDCHQIELKVHESAKAPKTEPKVDPDVCRHCHTEATSPAFETTKYMPEATCPKGEAVEPKKDAT